MCSYHPDPSSPHFRMLDVDGFLICQLKHILVQAVSHKYKHKQDSRASSDKLKTQSLQFEKKEQTNT